MARNPDDPRRNRRGQVMTPAFFRRWLKRERGDYGPSASSEQPAPAPRSKARLANPSTTAAASDQHDPNDPYQAYFLQRLAEVKERGYRQEVAS